MSNNSVAIFSYIGHDVRTVSIDGQPWFVLADIARILGLTNPTAAAGSVDDDDLSTAEVIDSMGRTQTARITNESGLYSLVFQSRKPNAKEFKRWVTHVVLPEIRRIGTYSAAPALPQSYAEALRELAATVEQNAQLEAKVAEDAPKVGYVDTFVRPDDLILFRNVAKALGWSESDLRVELVERKWIYPETDRRWSKSKQTYEVRTRYSAYADKARYFQPVPAHDAPRFRDREVMHTLKVTPAGAEAIARNFTKAVA